MEDPREATLDECAYCHVTDMCTEDSNGQPLCSECDLEARQEWRLALRED